MDYKETLNLPKTQFPMRANLPQNEPKQVEKWEREQIYIQMLEANGGKQRFILHDGPPYANGNIHIGHALNKILKDIIVKYKAMSGHVAPYVPGCDCHGLPIELQVEKKVEYEDHTTPSIYVKFRVSDPKGKFAPDAGRGTYFVIWTTTPWTLPANQAIAVHPKFIYRHVKTPQGELILNQELIPNVMK